MKRDFVGGVRARLTVHDPSVLATVRLRVRELGREANLAEGAVEALATAVTEIARNIVVHAGSGELLLGIACESDRRGVVVVASDGGPGIPNVPEAMCDGYTTGGGGLGLGLASAQRLVDDFEVDSSVPDGTTVTMRKWAPAERRP